MLIFVLFFFAFLLQSGPNKSKSKNNKTKTKITSKKNSKSKSKKQQNIVSETESEYESGESESSGEESLYSNNNDNGDEEYVPGSDTVTTKKKSRSRAHATVRKSNAKPNFKSKQSIAQLNAYIANERDRNGNQITKSWNEIVKEHASVQRNLYGKIVAKFKHNRIFGTRVEYANDDLKVNHSWSDFTKSWLRPMVSDNNSNSNSNSNIQTPTPSNITGKKRTRNNGSKTSTNLKKKQKLINSTTNGRKKNHNASIDSSNIYSIGDIGSFKFKFQLYINPSDTSEFWMIPMIKVISLQINKKTLLNRFKINKNNYPNWEDTNIYPSFDKIQTVVGGDLDFFANTESRSRSAYPDKNQWLSSQDWSSEKPIWSCKPFELIIYLELHLRNTNDQAEKDLIIGYVDCLKKIGLRPLKFYTSALLYELKTNKKDINKLHANGIINTANYIRTTHFLMLNQTCVRDYCGRDDVKTNGKFRANIKQNPKSNVNERLLYHFSCPDPLIIHNQGMVKFTDKNHSKSPLSLKDCIKVAKHFGIIKFRFCLYFFVCVVQFSFSFEMCHFCLTVFVFI